MKKEILKLCGNVGKSVDSQSIYQHKKSFFKKLGVSILACFMFCMPLFAGCSSLCQGGSAASPAPSGPLSDIAPKYAPSYLGLDPENDKTIFTTESGLEIKFGGANLSSGALKGYAYFTMGSYNGYAVNWVIIARHSGTTSATSPNLSQTTLTNFLNSQTSYDFGEYLEKTTPAGQAIYASASKGVFLFHEVLNFSSVPTLDNFLSAGEVYCISECDLFTTQFYTSSTTPKYEGSNLQTVCNNLPTTLGLTTAQTNLVVAKSIISRYNTVASTTAKDITSTNQKFYPPAVRHAVDVLGPSTNMLNSTALRIAYQIGTTTASWYWCRGGAYSSISNGVYIGSNGVITADSGTAVTNSVWLRPCC
ncbi:MAG: hypothetical protein J6K71_01770, partial [Clostridia bacterium]|nr:hypothetical protein [Clostridia bacterium]